MSVAGEKFELTERTIIRLLILPSMWSTLRPPQLFSNGMKFNFKLNRGPVREQKRV